MLSMKMAPFYHAVATRHDSAIELLQWSLTFDEVVSAYDKCKQESYVHRLKPLMEMQCEELARELIRDVVAVVFNYLGL